MRKQHDAGHGERTDLQRRSVLHSGSFCHGKIILELKAVGEFADEHRRQLLNYLRITKCKLGLLVNFGAYPRVGIERYVL